MIEQLKTQWMELVLKYSENGSLANDLWFEIKNGYTEKNRFYHNLSHIYNLLKYAVTLREKIKNFDNLLFATWYHDIIYKSTKKDNEEKSALLAKKRLELLKIDKETIQIVQKLIISTKKHQVFLNKNNDNAYFLDMDMAILGTNWNIYHNYLKNIRKEYAIFPNFMYKKGRIKVLKHFLERDTLYFTEYFKTRFETQARKNIKKEIELLQ
jgi:predicted metal-dependent HD superfamily phosphohydrolase